MPKEVSIVNFSSIPCPTEVPNQLDKLQVSHFGYLAQRRLARGLKLNHVEATVCIRSSLPAE